MAHDRPRPPMRRWQRCWCCFVFVFLPLLAVATVFIRLDLEARELLVTHPVIHIPGLPQEFAGYRIALVSDVHRGPFMSERRVAQMVARCNREKPDAVALAGDYVHRSRVYIPSVWRALSGLRARDGVYAVLGNHDIWESADLSREAMAAAGITNVTNRHAAVRRGNAVLYMAGVDDSWAGKPDLKAAMSGLPEGSTAILICHNPDYIEQVSDPRAKLWLSGHTHGGQVCLPSGRPIVHPSKCELRYLGGLAQCEQTLIYVSRGVGTVTPPIRWNCPAELPIIELQPG